MQDIVVDSSVVVKWLIVEPLSFEAHRILDGYQSGVYRLLAPDLIYAEVSNVIWKKQKFQGLTKADARKVFDEFQRLIFSVTPTSNLLEEAYTIAVAHDRTIYDALYVALSLRKGCPFVTADEKMVNALQPLFPYVLSVAHWPSNT
jgi:predicted nucleic acid-binding protein